MLRSNSPRYSPLPQDDCINSNPRTQPSRLHDEEISGFGLGDDTSPFTRGSSWRAIVSDIGDHAAAYTMALSAGLGGLAFGWDTGLIGGVLEMPAFRRAFGVDGLPPSQYASISGSIVASLQAGSFCGALCTALISRYGRLRACYLAGSIFVTGSLIQLFAERAQHVLRALYVGRFIGGFGVGVISVIVPAYIAECSPRLIRGRLTGMMQLMIVTGIAGSYWVNLLLVTASPDITMPPRFWEPWRVAFALQIAPGLAFLLAMLFQPESPRWLLERGRIAEGRSAFARLAGRLTSGGEPPEHELEELIREAAVQRGKGVSSTREQFAMVFSSRSNFYRASIGTIVMFFQQWTGTNSINYYSPQIFRQLGMSGIAAGLFATGVYGLVKVLCTTLCLLFVEDLGRKQSLLLGGLGQGTTMLFIALCAAQLPRAPTSSPTTASPLSYAAIAAVYVYVGFYSIGYGTIPWPLAAETAPSSVRSLAMSAALATQWGLNFAIAKLTPILLDRLSASGTFALFGSCCLVASIWVLLGLPETKGVRLEEMDMLFSSEEGIIRRSLADASLPCCGDRRRRGVAARERDD